MLQEDRTRTNTTLDKAPYVAPEISRKDLLDHRADLFALGVILFEMLTGTRPYDGQTEFDTIQNAVHGIKKDLRALAPTVSDDLVQIVESLIESNEDLRLPTAYDLLRALSRVGRREDIVFSLGALATRARALAAEDAAAEAAREAAEAAARAAAEAAAKEAAAKAEHEERAQRIAEKAHLFASSPAPEPVLTLSRERMRGGEKVVAVAPLEVGQPSGMEAAYVWSAEGKDFLGAGRTKRQLIAAWGPPERTTIKLVLTMEK